jgi:flagella basal body P-ring formation protein FlgA
LCGSARRWAIAPLGAFLLGACVSAAAGTASLGSIDAAVRAALMDAVQRRVGRDVKVALDEVRWSIPSVSSAPFQLVPVAGTGDGTASAGREAGPRAIDGLVATPDPGARVGQRVRFTVVGRRTGHGPGLVRLGEASAIVSVRGTVARLTAAVGRGDVVSAEAIEAVEAAVEDAPLKRWPSPAEVAGGRASRPLSAGHAVAAGDVADAVTVRSGDRVRVTARVAGAAVATVGVAEQAGMIDQVIRVVNLGSRRALRARVVASGEVEVIDAR